MPVVDVLQFIYASRRSGTLHMESRNRRGFVVFRDGNIVQASTNAADNSLGHILIARGRVTDEDLAAAVAAQRLQYKGMPLGRVMVELGLLEEPDLKAAVVHQIEGAVRDFVLWLDGDFVFELGAGGDAPDDVSVSLEGILSGVNVDTQHLLLECIRIFDERGKEEADRENAERATEQAEALIIEPEAEVTPPEEIEAPEPASHTVFLYSNSEPLAAFLSSIATQKKVECRAFQSFTALMLALEGVAAKDRLPVVILDVDFGVKSQQQARGKRAGELISKLKAAARTVDVICVAGRVNSALRISLMERHARAVVGMPPPATFEQQPPPPDVRNFLRELWTTVIEAFRNYEAVYVKRQWRTRIRSLESYLIKLKKFVREAQKSNFSFLVSLDLLNIISENYERALLLVVREGQAAGIGGFGDADDGTPLGIIAKGITVDLGEDSVFKTVAERRTTYRGRPDASEPAHRKLFDEIGEPRSGEVMVVPLISNGRTLAMIYCDNGEYDKALIYDELLDLLSNQTHILYERMLAETIPAGAGGNDE
jgi:hypothetical protein